jgi:hypothetical protein
MKYTYSKLTRTPLATIDNDAKGCFTFIICNLAMLISQHYGIDKKYCILQSNYLNDSQFCIWTALGDSDRIYKHTATTPIHGTSQGSCASPAIWLLIDQPK